MPKHHHHPPHHGGHHHPPPPPHHGGHHPHHAWENPLPAEEDFEVLEALLQDTDLANSVWRAWREESPWEVAAIGAVVLRSLGVMMRAFPEQFSAAMDNAVVETQREK